MSKQRYAATTEVSSDRSKEEIERTLTRYGATHFGYVNEVGKSVTIMFRLNDRHIKYVVPMPDPQSDEFTTYYRGSVRWARTDSEALRLYEQAIRQRWRALLLVIKAKLEAVDLGITTAEDEFLSATVLADGQTVSEWAQPQIEQMYRLGTMPTHLQLGPGRTT